MPITNAIFTPGVNHACSTLNMATQPTSQLTQEFDLVTINTSMRWPTHDEMRHQSVCIKLRYTGTPMNEIKKVINEIMKGTSASSPQKKTIIYSNMRDKIVKLGKKVENYLDSDDEKFLINVDIIHRHHLTRTQCSSPFCGLLLLSSMCGNLEDVIFILKMRCTFCLFSLD